MVFFLFPWYGTDMNTTSSWLSRHITLHSYADEKSERENTVTHLVGFIAALFFFFFILFAKQRFPDQATFIGMLIYSITLMLLYGSSSAYHATTPGDAKRLFRVFDHSNIYFLIAGTYTPILLYIGTPITRLITIFIWAVAIFGIGFTLLFWGKLRALHVAFYLVMGWMIVFFWKDIVPFIPSGLVYWIFSAGITYTVGVIFYSLRRMRHSHMIWHLFCVAASAQFCIGFLLYLGN
jgi:hemolysin III